jgi:PAS domain S-box-containing protein
MASRYGMQMIGVAREEIEGVAGTDHFRYYQMFQPDGTPATLEQLPLARALTAGEIIRNEEWLLQRRDGLRIPVLIHAGPVREPDGTITAAVISWQDITERKQTEAQLQRSNERYRFLAEAIPQPVWCCDAMGAVIECNRRWYEYTGQTPAQAQGGGWMQVVHPDDLARVSEQVRKDAAAGNIYQAEYRLRRASDGSYRWHLARALPMKDPDGRIRYWFGSATDIEDQKQAEEQLRTSERTLRALVDASPEAIVLLDRAGTVLLANRVTAERLGHTVAEIIGHRMADLLPAEVVANRMRRFQEVVRTGQPVRFEDLRAGRSIENSFCPVFDAQGQVASVALLAIDRTERKRTEDALRSAHDQLEQRVQERTAELAQANAELQREIEERERVQETLRQSHDELQTIYDSMVDGLLIGECPSGRFLRTNPAMCRMLGYTADELLSMSVVDIHPAEVAPAVLEKFRRHQVGQRLITLERPMRRKDGTVFYADISNACISYQGRPCLIGIFRDITERKQAQEALERERQSLWKMLQASDHERQIIAYEIHDGLAQYLAAAGMQLQVAEHLRDSAPEEAKKAYAAALQLVNQSHFEARRLISEVRPPVIDEIGLETAISHLVHEQRRHRGPKIQFESNVQFDRLAAILENSLYRIVQEALGNACQHSQCTEVKVTLVQEGQELRLDVQDDGIGFDPATVEKGHFGLEGIRQRVRLLGGQLRIDSTAAAGTHIQVVVPLFERQGEG